MIQWHGTVVNKSADFAPEDSQMLITDTCSNNSYRMVHQEKGQSNCSSGKILAEFMAADDDRLIIVFDALEYLPLLVIERHLWPQSFGQFQQTARCLPGGRLAFSLAP